MKEKKEGLFNFPNLILLVVMLLIPFLFFIFLNLQTSTGFGLAEIAVSIMLGVVSTLFLIWTKTVIAKNAYLGLIIGVVALAIFEYSLFYRYQGINTVIFSLVGGIIVLIYLGFYFFKDKDIPLGKDDLRDIEEEFEE